MNKSIGLIMKEVLNKQNTPCAERRDLDKKKIVETIKKEQKKDIKIFFQKIPQAIRLNQKNNQVIWSSAQGSTRENEPAWKTEIPQKISN